MNQTKHKITGLRWLLPFLIAAVLSLSSIMPAMAASAPDWKNNSCYGTGNPLTKQYKYQCTWYVWGRVREITGIKMSGLKNRFVDSSSTGGYVSTPSTNSIAVYFNSAGTILHVAFIENYDGTNVTFSEGNNKSKGTGDQKYYTAKMTLSKFKARKVNSSCKSLKYIPLQKTTAPSASVSVQTKAATEIGETNATVNGQVTKTSGVTVTSCGVYLGTSSSNMTKRNTEKLSSSVNKSHSGTGFKIWYNLTDELKIKLEKGTTYYFKIYIISGGKEYQGSVMSFTTKGHKHTPGAAATCESAQTCTTCGAVITKALGHSPGPEATCTEDQICTRCGKLLAEATGHSPGPEATCESAQTCTKCGAVITEALGHSLDPSVECTKEQVCERCGKTVSKAVGHSPGPEATCTEDQICERCGEVLTEALGHSLDPSASCTEEQVCERCGEVLPPAGHKWGSWTTVRTATVFQKKLQVRTCSVCDEIESRETGSKLKPTIKVSASTLTIRVKKTSTALKVTSMAKGDYLKSVSVKNKKLLKVSNVKKNGTMKLTALKKGTVKVTLKLASGKSKTVTVKVV